MAADTRGLCPRCESRAGEVGSACPDEVCSRHGYHFIPLASLEAARAFAAKRQKPLDPMLGRRIDRYLLAGNLGQGGMGAVYLALQYPLFHEVALKVISGIDPSPQAVTRFEREARAISALDHPNIVKLHDYGVAEFGESRVPYMAIEYVRHGRTLRNVLARAQEEEESPPTAIVLAIFRQILHALGAAHQRGFVHRDVKPENIMITSVLGTPNFVKILDFGLARSVAFGTGADGDVSGPNQVLGTIHYMAPEQIPRHGHPPEVDGRVDLYAVAVMLFEISCGVRPFDGDNAIEVIARKIDPEFRPLDLPEARRLSRRMRALLEKGLAASPDERFANAAAMLTVLEAALAERAGSLVGFMMPAGGASDPGPTPPAEAGAPAGRKEPSGARRAPVAEETRVEVPAAPPLRKPSEPRPRPPEDLPEAPEPQPGHRPSEPRRFRPPSSHGARTVNPFRAEGSPFPARDDGGDPLEVDWGDRATQTPPPPPQPAPPHPPPQPELRDPVRPPQARSLPRPSLDAHAAPKARTVADSRAARRPPRPRQGVTTGLSVAVAVVLLGAAAWPATCLVTEWLKVENTREELATIRAALSPSGHFLGVASGRLDPGDKLDYYLRETVDGEAPAYPTRDPWGKRYRVRWGSEFKRYLLFSTGPDGEPGLCRDEDQAGDDLCVSLGP
jgi:hypothetical protein